MIFDRIEWDEHNLDHAAKRLTAADIERAIWNADRMGGMRMPKATSTAKTEAELADFYNETQDLSGFDEENAVPVTVKRSVTISVRFSDAEIAEVRARAEEAGVKVTSFIRGAALEATSPVDRAALGALACDLEQRAHQVAEFVARGA